MTIESIIFRCRIKVKTEAMKETFEFWNSFLFDFKIVSQLGLLLVLVRARNSLPRLRQETLRTCLRLSQMQIRDEAVLRQAVLHLSERLSASGFLPHEYRISRENNTLSSNLVPSRTQHFLSAI